MIAVIAPILWGLGLLSAIGGGLIHIFLVVIFVLVVVQWISGGNCDYHFVHRMEEMAWLKY